MFRSVRREVVFPQAEHARLAGSLAIAWGNERFARPALLPFDSFVRGVTLHDRGYGLLDQDEIGRMDPVRWAEIQLAGFRAQSGDPVVDLIAGLHVRRLARNFASDPAQAAAAEMERALPDMISAAGVSERDAMEADAVTDLCDRIAFDFCFEQPGEGSVAVVPAAGAAHVPIAYGVDGEGGITLDPWPLGVPELPGLIFGFDAAQYPVMLSPVVTPFHARPEQRG
jgi:hypothetical protein